jgi:hypothetical protein
VIAARVGRGNLILAAAVTTAASAVSIAAILWIRRHKPDGGFFNDGDRAAGVFGVLATEFTLLLGFVVSSPSPSTTSRGPVRRRKRSS